MKRRNRIAFNSIMLFLLFLIYILLPGQIEAQDDIETNSIFLYLHGPPGEGLLNTSRGFQEEHTVLTTDRSSIQHMRIELGMWNASPILYPMIIQESIGFALYAKGELQSVTFIIEFMVNEVVVADEMVSDTQNLDPDIPVMFTGESVQLPSTLELNESDVISLRLSLEHNDPEYYNRWPPPGSGKNVTLVLGYDWGTFVNFKANSVQIVEITDEDDPITGNILITATIKCCFGISDYYLASAKSDYGTLTLLSDTIVDQSTISLEFDWDYSASEGGSYPITITVRDQNYNSWKMTKDISILTPQTEVDFSLSEKYVTFPDEIILNENNTITAKIWGGGKRWDSYNVDVEFYDGSSLIEEINIALKIDKRVTANVIWVPTSKGIHTVRVKVDPDDNIRETNELNNEVLKEVEVKESSGSGQQGVPGFEVVCLLIAFFSLGLLNRHRKLK